MDQLTFADPECATHDVLVFDTVIPKELFLAADAPTGRVWCWQVDADGKKLKTIEVKTGTVTIREHTDAESGTDKPAE